VGPASLGLDLSLHAWVNDGLMTLFSSSWAWRSSGSWWWGELAHPRAAAMPVVAALGGMVVPALPYILVNGGGPGRPGWAIPLATDIAFVLGALALLGSRDPAGLRLSLLAVAIVDDLGAIAVIALFYAAGINAVDLTASGAVLLIVVALRRWGVTNPWSMWLRPWPCGTSFTSPGSTPPWPASLSAC
jgi:NhaA family Na+:H+ antiporter